MCRRVLADWWPRHRRNHILGSAIDAGLTHRLTGISRWRDQSRLEAFGVTGAFALPNGSRDSALVLTLAPGTYTAQVGAVDNTSTGIALVEIYELPE